MTGALAVLYTPFPSNWPEYTPRDKIADWVETYASIQDLVVWTSTEMHPHPRYDLATRTWTVTVDCAGEPVTLHPAHIVIATGTLGRPNVPSFPGMDAFRGQAVHSSQYPGARALAGKRVVVVGAAQSAADICQDLALRGSTEEGLAGSVTMVQRSPTCVMTRDFVNGQVKGAWPEDVPVEVSDFRFAAFPLKLMRQIAIASQEQALEAHREVHEKLRKGGAHVDLGPEGQGVYPLVYERYGGKR